MPVTRSQSIAQANNGISGYKRLDTPTKCRIQGACDALDMCGIKGKNQEIFKGHGVSNTQGWDILREEREHRRLGGNKTRGRSPLITPNVPAKGRKSETVAATKEKRRKEKRRKPQNKSATTKTGATRPNGTKKIARCEEVYERQVVHR
jgi:hypothetical protein